jgi:hypothetical protein
MPFLIGPSTMITTASTADSSNNQVANAAVLISPDAVSTFTSKPVKLANKLWESVSTKKQPRDYTASERDTVDCLLDAIVKQSVTIDPDLLMGMWRVVYVRKGPAGGLDHRIPIPEAVVSYNYQIFGNSNNNADDTMTAGTTIIYRSDFLQGTVHIEGSGMYEALQDQSSIREGRNMLSSSRLLPSAPL